MHANKVLVFLCQSDLPRRLLFFSKVQTTEVSCFMEVPGNIGEAELAETCSLDKLVKT